MAATDYYVTTTGAGSKNGLSWANAFSWAEFETDAEGSAEAGDRYFFEEGTYTLTQDFVSLQDGTAIAPIEIIGVKSGTTNEPPVPSDWADGDNCPLWASSTYDLDMDNYWIIWNIRITTTHDPGITIDHGAFYINVKVTQTGAGADAFVGYSGENYIDCEASASSGIAFAMNINANATGCYAHDSTTGFSKVGDGGSLKYCIADTCTTGLNVVSNDNFSVTNNVFYNNTTGISGNVGSRNVFLSNAITNNATGASWITEQKCSVWDYNNWYSNSVQDVSNVAKGPNATAVDPKYADAPNGDFSLDADSDMIDAGFNINVGV
jgi:hypothetical protein